jgi:hypothetical protein
MCWAFLLCSNGCAHVQSLLPRGQMPNPLRERNSAVNRIMEEHVKGKVNLLAHFFCADFVSFEALDN